MMRSLWPLLCGAAAICHLGCYEFQGELEAIGFRSNLGRPLLPWSPVQPIARGAVVTVQAVHEIGAGGWESVPPRAVPRLEGEAAQAVALDVDLATFLAQAEGEAELTWTGPNVQDRFGVTVREAASARVLDPLRHYLLRNEVAVVGEVPEDPGPDVHLVGGAPYLLDLVLFDADGALLAHAPDLLAIHPDVGLPAGPDGHGLLLDLPEQAPAAPGGVSVRLEATLLLRFEVRAAQVAAAAALKLGAHPLGGGAHVLLASPLAADGALLHQAPVEWVLDELLEPVPPEKFDYQPRRRDVLLVAARGDLPPGDYLSQVTARLGQVQDTLQLSFTVSRREQTEQTEQAPPPVPPEPEDPRGCAGCSSLPGASWPWGLVVLGWAGARRLSRAGPSRSNPAA
jgi:hypothetical protein